MGSEEFSWAEVKIALADPKVILRYVSQFDNRQHTLTAMYSGLIQFCQDILLYGFSTFLPSIIKSLGYNTLQAQYLTIPVYIFGGGAFMVIAYISDRTSIRGPLVAFANIFGIIGYILIICPTPNGVKFLGTFLCAVAVYNGPGLNMSWLNVNVAPQCKHLSLLYIRIRLLTCTQQIAEPLRLEHSRPLVTLQALLPDRSTERVRMSSATRSRLGLLPWRRFSLLASGFILDTATASRQESQMARLTREKCRLAMLLLTSSITCRAGWVQQDTVYIVLWNYERDSFHNDCANHYTEF